MHVPLSVRFAAPAVSPGSSWGPPDATFTVDSCDLSQFFDPANIIFDLTLCGDWANAVFSAYDGCTAGLGLTLVLCRDCQTRWAVLVTATIVSVPLQTKFKKLTIRLSDVDNTPDAFTEAYWEINSLRVYTPLSASPAARWR